MREIVLDTETTGLDPGTGHRLVEIGAIELLNRMPTGKSWHYYLNPERTMPEEAFRVHGLSLDFLKDKPLFAEKASDFLSFIGDSLLVIHNAPFDMKFLNAELAWADHPPISMNQVVDTLALARKKYPGAKNSLDALCSRFGITTAHRTLHGALLDSELLVDVYLELRGGRQLGLQLNEASALGEKAAESSPRALQPRDLGVWASSVASSEERAAHATMTQGLKDALWLKLQQVD